jgi:hypothetical protein
MCWGRKQTPTGAVGRKVNIDRESHKRLLEQGFLHSFSVRTSWKPTAEWGIADKPRQDPLRLVSVRCAHNEQYRSFQSLEFPLRAATTHPDCFNRNDLPGFPGVWS